MDGLLRTADGLLRTADGLLRAADGLLRAVDDAQGDDEDGAAGALVRA